MQQESRAIRCFDFMIRSGLTIFLFWLLLIVLGAVWLVFEYGPTIRVIIAGDSGSTCKGTGRP